MATEHELKMIPMLRDEAGLNGEVLRAIVRRELAADRVASLSGPNKLHSDEMKDFMHKSREVELLKEEYGIPEPIPLLPEEE